MEYAREHRENVQSFPTTSVAVDFHSALVITPRRHRLSAHWLCVNLLFQIAFDRITAAWIDSACCPLIFPRNSAGSSFQRTLTLSATKESCLHETQRRSISATQALASQLLKLSPGLHVPQVLTSMSSRIKDHAENWALRQHSQLREECVVVTIDTSKLGDVYVIKLSTVGAAFKLHLPDGASQHHSGAFLCLRQVPANAVCSIERTSEIQRRKVTSV